MFRGSSSFPHPSDGLAMPFPSREAQTRIKHEILREYAGAYGGIIARGVGRRAPADAVLDLAYFDGFAGFGRYAGDLDQPGEIAPVWDPPSWRCKPSRPSRPPPVCAFRAPACSPNR